MQARVLKLFARELDTMETHFWMCFTAKRISHESGNFRVNTIRRFWDNFQFELSILQHFIQPRVLKEFLSELPKTDNQVFYKFHGETHVFLELRFSLLTPYQAFFRKVSNSSCGIKINLCEQKFQIDLL